MAEPFIGQIMPVAFDYAPVDWALCQGQELSIDQYQALFALLSNRFGGDGITTFHLPDLRGRVILGTGVPLQSQTNYVHASTGGNVATPLTEQNLPSHVHDASLVFSPEQPPVASGEVALSVGALASLPVTVTSASMSVSNAAGQANTPSGANTMLAAPPPIPTVGATTQPVRIYGPAGTDVPLANPVAIQATAEGTIEGTATGSIYLPVSPGESYVTVKPNEGPEISLIPVMQPYMALNTIIAMTGIWPPRT